MVLVGDFNLAEDDQDNFNEYFRKDQKKKHCIVEETVDVYWAIFRWPSKLFNNSHLLYFDIIFYVSYLLYFDLAQVPFFFEVTKNRYFYFQSNLGLSQPYSAVYKKTS